MADDPKPIASETDLALISFARAVLGVLQVTDVVRPKEIGHALKFYEDLMIE